MPITTCAFFAARRKPAPSSSPGHPSGSRIKPPFSVRIGVTSQTLPTSNEVLVYLSFGVRRWVPVRPKLSLAHAHSVYIAPTLPYLTEAGESRHFGIAKIKATRVRGEDGTMTYPAQWDDDLAEVLRELGCLNRLPDPQQLADKPLDYLQGVGDAAALVYQTGMLHKEKVSAGLSLADREPLVRWVAAELDPHLELAAPLPREKTVVYKGLGGINNEAIPAQHLSEVLGPRVTFELLTDTSEATGYALERLSARLGVDLPEAGDLDDTETLIDLGPITVGLRKLTRPDIAADLDRVKSRTKQAAVDQRVDHIVDSLGAAGHPTATLVEIAPAEAYQTSKRGGDPKFAIRHGLVRTGRLSQFVNPVKPPTKPGRIRADGSISDANRERFAAAVDELFRHLGVRPAPLPAPEAGTLTRQPALLALWMIRKNKTQLYGLRRQVPVAVLIDPTGRHVQVRAPQIDWEPLHQGLVDIGRLHVNAELKCGTEDVLRFIKETIAEATAAYPDLLLLTHAQNLRSVWGMLANTRIGLDTISYGTEEAEPISVIPGLRHVRVRGSSGGETPQCFGVNEDGSGQPKGLWQLLRHRVFGSTSGKPSTQSGALMGVSKLVPSEHKGKPTVPKPKARVWNPQLIELFVAGLQDGDRPEHWAALTHELRDAAPYARDTTILPWPLHLAGQIEEYLIPTRVSATGDSEASGENPET
ncbi:RNaseH domain-containing protein [Kribbella sp. NPDC056861]|uniref:RNaseH domain-containing protein n=1 Tax=Kribbella sp. NPDC056861 TaxID=3154857 RepID=UPI00341DA62F